MWLKRSAPDIRLVNGFACKYGFLVNTPETSGSNSVGKGKIKVFFQSQISEGALVVFGNTSTKITLKLSAGSSSC